MLILFTVADVATELGAVELSMRLELIQSLPDDFTMATTCMATMRKFTEIDTVFNDFVYFLHEITSGLAVRAADVELWGK